MSAEHPFPPPNAEEDGLASFILNMADFAGWQEDAHGGSFQTWHLRKSLVGHPKGSTVARSTLERAYRAGKYGAAHAAGKSKDFAAVESPELP